MTRLHTDALRLVRGSRALLDDVKLAIETGEVVAILGENGAGKSTLLDALAGLTPELTARVHLDEVALSTLLSAQRAARIASLDQSDLRPFGLTVRARIAQGLAPRRGPDALVDANVNAQVESLANQLALSPFLDRTLDALSGGERRRAHIARALIDVDADFVLLDEPFAGVDLRHRALVTDAIRARAAHGAGVVVTVHDLTLLDPLADRVVGLAAGRVVYEGGPAEATAPDALRAVYGLSH